MTGQPPPKHTFIYCVINSSIDINRNRNRYTYTVPTSYIYIYYIYKLSSIRNNHKIGNMTSIIKETKQKRTRKRPGRKERRRKRQEEAKNNNGSAISNINKNITDLNINKSNVIIVQSPMKIWLLKHSGEDDEVPDEICDYIKSMASDTSVDIEDVINVIQQFIPAFSTKLTSAEQHEEVQILLNIIQNKNNDNDNNNASKPVKRVYETVERPKITDNFLDLSKIDQRKSWMRNKIIDEKQQGKWKDKKSNIKKQLQEENKEKSNDMLNNGLSNFEDCNFSTLNKNNSNNNSSSDICVRLNAVEMRYDASQLLRESDVTFLTNHRYGLIGQNGVGKSTLLYWVEKIAKENMSVLYVAQEAVGDDTSAINAVKQLR